LVAASHSHPSATRVSQSKVSDFHHQQYRRGHAVNGNSPARATSSADGVTESKMRPLVFFFMVKIEE